MPPDVPQARGSGQQEEPLSHHSSKEEGIWKEGQKDDGTPGSASAIFQAGQPAEKDTSARVTQPGDQQPGSQGISHYQTYQTHEPDIERKKDQEEMLAVFHIASVPQLRQLLIVNCVPLAPGGKHSTLAKKQQKEGGQGKDNQPEQKRQGKDPQLLTGREGYSPSAPVPPVQTNGTRDGCAAGSQPSQQQIPSSENYRTGHQHGPDGVKRLPRQSAHLDGVAPEIISSLHSLASIRL